MGLGDFAGFATFRQLGNRAQAKPQIRGINICFKRQTARTAGEIFKERVKNNL